MPPTSGGLLAQYEKLLKRMRPGDTGEITLEPWMGIRSAKQRLLAAAHAVSLDLTFGRSADPRKLVFRVENLSPDTPALKATTVGPPPPKKNKNQPAKRPTSRSYVFDLTPYEEILSSASPGDSFEISLTRASPDVIKYRMHLVAKRFGYRLEFGEPSEGKLAVTVHDRSWRRSR